MTDDYIHLWFLPWADLGETITVGEVVFFDYFKERTSRYSKLQRKALNSFFKQVFDYNGKPVKSVFIAEYAGEGENDRSTWNDKVQWAVKALSFSYSINMIINQLVNDTTPQTQPCSERFQSFCVAFFDGGVLHSDSVSHGWSSIDGGNRKYFPPIKMPLQIGAPDRVLLEALGKVNDFQFESNLWDQLGVCMEWFSNAYTLSPDVSQPVRYVSLMTAFESLIRRHTREDAIKLGKRLVKLCKWGLLPKTETAIKDDEIVISITKPQKFIIEYAGYRNIFVHGGRLPWGHVEHRVGQSKYDIKSVMSLVIYCIITRLVVAGRDDDDIVAILLEKSVTEIVEALNWNNSEPCRPSPHHKADSLSIEKKSDGSYLAKYNVWQYSPAIDTTNYATFNHLTRGLRAAVIPKKMWPLEDAPTHNIDLRKLPKVCSEPIISVEISTESIVIAPNSSDLVKERES